MTTLDVSILAALILAAALLYSAVVYAGASGYLAAMALFGLTPDVMKPTALVLNILVASITTVRFYRAGFFSWPLLWPFVLGSIPASFIGGALQRRAPLQQRRKASASRSSAKNSVWASCWRPCRPSKS
jgi:uncharacterized membrane protein YfcA